MASIPNIRNKEHYDKLFANGPPLFGTQVDTSDFREAGLIELWEPVKDLIEKPTICFAIWSGQEDQLVRAFDAAFEANHLTYDFEEVEKVSSNGFPYTQRTRSVDELQNLPALQRLVTSTGEVLWTVVAWTKESGFHTKKIKVQYGNCANCYRAYPLGWSCENPECSELDFPSDSCRFYVVTETPIPQEEPPVSKKADPLYMVAMTDGRAHVSLDNTLFQPRPETVDKTDELLNDMLEGYRPTERTLWCPLWLEAWLRHIDFRVFPFVERELQKATRLPMESIQKAMDKYQKENLSAYPKRTWDSIARARMLPDAVYNGAPYRDE